jgi:hypothetical protein
MPLLPGGVPSDPASDAFSARHASQLIERLAVEPRPIGSAASERARRMIVDELRQLGLDPRLQTIEVRDYFGINGGSPVELANVLSRIPGRASTGAVALVGHYDTVPTSPGANDDASAVAVILEVARAILAGPPVSNDVILLFTDGEEPAPRFGSSAFVAEHPWAGDVAFVVNLEAIGGYGPATLISIAGPAELVLEGYAASVPRPMAFSYLTATTALIGGSISDFDTFRNARVPGVELAYLHGSSIYHTMADAPDRVSVGSLQHAGESALAITRQVANLDLAGPQPAESTVFLTIGRTVVRYPAAATLVAVVLAGIALVLGVFAVARTRRRLVWRGVSRGLLALAVALVATNVGAVVTWSFVAGVRTDMGFAESYLYLAGLVAFAWAVHVGVRRFAAARSDPLAIAVGVAAAWWLLGSPIALAMPEIGYLFAWPTLVAGAVILVRSSGGGGNWFDLAGFALVATTVLVLMVPAVDTFYQLAQPRPGNPDSQLLWLIAVPATLVALTVELLAAFWPRAVARGTRDGSTLELTRPSTDISDI